jgi:hypothetical protein
MLANPYYTSVVELRQTAEERISLIETPTPLKRDDA